MRVWGALILQAPPPLTLSPWIILHQNMDRLPTSSTLTSTGSSQRQEKTSKKKFQLKAKRLFLTFPQCSVTKEQAQERLLSKFPEELTWYIIAEEAHADGTPHLHLALEFKQEFSTRKTEFFDFVGGKHGNYQAMKNQRKCVQYVVKGGKYVVHGLDVDALMKKKDGKSAFVAKSVLDGKTIDEINSEDPGFFMMNKRKIEEYAAWCSVRKEKKNKLEWNGIPEGDIMDMDSEADKEISTWLNLNIRKPRDLRQEQLYIYGPPQMGKTSLIEHLSKYLNIYHVPRDEDFYDGYEDGVYDLCVMDEFKHSKTMQWLNAFLDGQVVTLRQKGKQLVKKDRLPVIVLSNYTLEQNYKKLFELGHLGPLVTRFKVVEVKEFISVFQ